VGTETYKIVTTPFVNLGIQTTIAGGRLESSGGITLG
jgi:hypothetical protein